MIPDKLTADYSEKYEVSIRLTSNGLSFWGYIPTEKDSFFSETYPFEHDLSAVESLKNIFFANACFSFRYQSCNMICVSARYTLMPALVFREKEKVRLFNFCHPKDDSLKVLADSVKGLNVSLLYGMDEDIYAFLVRSLTNPRFIHALSPVLACLQKQSLMRYPKQMLVILREDMIDVICMQQGELLFANSFQYDSDSDIVYYLLYICRQTDFNQLEDSLLLSGEQHRCRSVLAVIRKYIRQAECLQPALKNHPSTHGQYLPMDTVALMECVL